MVHHFKEAQTKAQAAYIDGRLENFAYKHTQLGALFELLQSHGTTYLRGDSSTKLHLELEYTLKLIATSINDLPTDLWGAFKAHQSLKDVPGGRRRRAVGTVIIVHSISQPISSWALPLARAIVDGNATIILVSPQGAKAVPQLRPHLDSMAYQIVVTDFESDPIDKHFYSVNGLIGPARSLGKLFPSVPAGSVQVRSLNDGPPPIIVDQSILPSGKPLSPREESNQLIPEVLLQTARHLACIRGVIDNAYPSLGSPSFVLVHENIAKPFARALVSAGVNFTFEELLPVSQVKSYLENLQDGKSEHLVVYTVRSFDMAMDFVQDNLSTPSTVYVLASTEFSIYAFNSLREVHNICLGGVSIDQVLLGPYADLEALSFTTTARLVRSTLTESVSRPSDLTKLTYRRIKRSAGSRIDFFGGSFMFAAGIAALLSLSGTGFGFFKGALFAYHKFVQ